jgi:hypothetical protein
MRTLTLTLLLLLTACAVDATEAQQPNESLIATAQAPLPQTMVLEDIGVVFAGTTVQLALTGATPGATLRLARTDGAFGVGNCPPLLGGACLDITPGTTGYVLAGTAIADTTGAASFELTIPGGVTYAEAVLQAVDVGAGTGSNPIEVFGVCSGPEAGVTEIFDCNGLSACQFGDVVCPDGADCLVECGGESSCQFIDVICPADGSCDVVCDGTSACQFITMTGGAGNLDLECSGSNACQFGDLVCGEGPCLTSCDGAAFLDPVDSSLSCAFIDDGCL